MTSKTGRCLCGAVTYRFTGDIVSSAHCHCESCRRATGSPITSFVSVQKATLTFSGETLGVYPSSPGVLRRFCTRCGSPLAYEWDGRPGIIDLQATSLDDHDDFAAQKHEFWNERVGWLNVVDALPKETGA